MLWNDRYLKMYLDFTERIFVAAPVKRCSKPAKRQEQLTGT